jgi:hypothetical protein
MHNLYTLIFSVYLQQFSRIDHTRVGFEPTISVFEKVKPVRASDRAATVVGYSSLRLLCIRLEYGVIMYYFVLHE